MSEILQKLAQSFEDHARRTAFVHSEKGWTYGEMKAKAAAIQQELQKAGASGPVGLHLTNDFEMYAALLAIWAEGLAYVPLHPDFPPAKNQKIIEQSGCQIIISSQPGDAHNLSKTVLDSTSCVAHDMEWTIKPTAEDALAYILFTSGSTGEPKGVPITFSNLKFFCDSYQHTFGKPSKDDVYLQMFELTFDMSVVSYLVPLLHGASFVGLHDQEVKFLQILDLLEQNKITVAQLVPSIANLMLPYLDPNVQNNSLRSVFFAGEALLAKTIRAWRKLVPNAKIYNSYGPTENTIICATYEIPENDAKEVQGVLSIGQPMKHNILRFADNTANEGELLLGGKLLTPHYWKNPNKDAETFIYLDGERFYKTGDLCRRDEDGDIFYINRLDFQAKINGFRVELAEIEHFANQKCHHGSCVALTEKDDSGNDILLLFTDDKAVLEDEILHYLSENLPPYMLPSQIIKCDSFPYNTAGKVDRQALKKLKQ